MRRLVFMVDDDGAPRAAIPVALLVLVLATTPAAAHHHQTPAVVRLTNSGDTDLPRVASAGGALTLVAGSPAGVFLLDHLYRRDHRDAATPIATGAEEANPVLSSHGSILAWDADAGLGRQVFLRLRGMVQQASPDASATSTNPAINRLGNLVAFESSGNLTGAAAIGGRQVFLRSADGSLRQASRGSGVSRNPVLTATGNVVAFDSTSDPITGEDTGISQLWLYDRRTDTARPVTAGRGPSGEPTISPEGRLVIFQSTADLAGQGDDTGTTQVFAYDVRTATFAQITADGGGCRRPSVYPYIDDWRIAFTCGGVGFFYLVRADQRYRLPIAGGDTPHAVAELDPHFVLVSTTTDLLSGGTTPGHQIYLINLFKLPGELVPGQAVWFPRRGVPAAR